jgi:HAD superfamily hydrolase (TIGR01509 family)
LRRVIVAHSPTDLRPGPLVKGLLFDWDGTLFDNHHANFVAMQQALGTYGVSIDEPWFDRNSGYSARQIVARAVNRQGIKLDTATVLRTRDQFAVEQMADLKLVEPVHQIIREFQRHLRLAVVTGSERSMIEPVLQAFDLVGVFDPIVSRDMIRAGKPDPAGYQLALQLMGLAAWEGLAYEDSDEGVQSARGAGLDVVDIRVLRRGSNASIPDHPTVDRAREDCDKDRQSSS